MANDKENERFYRFKIVTTAIMAGLFIFAGMFMCWVGHNMFMLTVGDGSSGGIKIGGFVEAQGWH